jgi:lysozyme
MKILKKIGSILLVAMLLLVAGVVVHEVFFPGEDPLLMRTIFGSDNGRKPFSNDYDGIDVSHHQGRIDWPVLGANQLVGFVYVKATEGSSHIDSRFHHNVKGARKAGIPVGAYHFLSSKSSIASQFLNFYHQAKPGMLDLRPIVDVEWQGVGAWTTRQLCDSLSRFVWLVEQYYGRKPIIYADAKFYKKHLSGRFSSYPLFIAHYRRKRPSAPGADSLLIWQRSENGHVAGIGRDVDLDVLMPGVTVDDLRL